MEDWRIRIIKMEVDGRTKLIGKRTLVMTSWIEI